MIQHACFDSLPEFIAATRGMPPVRNVTGDWTLGVTHSQACEYALTGYTAGGFVERAQALLDRIQTLTVETEAMDWINSPYGGHAIVPEFLAGLPDPMRVRRHTETESVPLTIWVDICVSSAVSTAQLESRGLAILALILKLQGTRPVDLNLMCLTDPSPAKGYRKNTERGLIITLNTRPLELATAGFALCHPAFFRQMVLGFEQHGLGYDTRKTLPITDPEKFRTRCDIPANDLIIPGYLQGRREVTDVTADPIGWVNRQLERTQC